MELPSRVARSGALSICLFLKKLFKNITRAFISALKKAKLSARIFVILFGSVARGNYRIDSDVDVLVITSKVKDEWDRAKISLILHNAIMVEEPFEIHVATKEEFESWYKRFINVYEEF
ncbi:nucleotidyltransferase domain-containing protein [Sulfolobus tengchongensis]|uniref:Nucleotidyltransferase domain-containing protein n=1 Tax=Sulfolobus tengchongensis TaxID=207809 RepID=A0AAX4KX79_9CREN